MPKRWESCQDNSVLSMRDRYRTELARGLGTLHYWDASVTSRASKSTSVPDQVMVSTGQISDGIRVGPKGTTSAGQPQPACSCGGGALALGAGGSDWPRSFTPSRVARRIFVREGVDTRPSGWGLWWRVRSESYKVRSGRSASAEGKGSTSLLTFSLADTDDPW